MTNQELRAIMLESRLPEEAWPCGFDGLGDPHIFGGLAQHGGAGDDVRLTIAQAAALCEVALRRAIRAAVGDGEAIIETWGNACGWCCVVKDDSIGPAYKTYDAPTELHALARLHAAVVERNRP